jgi:hypothetical protein
VAAEIFGFTLVSGAHFGIHQGDLRASAGFAPFYLGHVGSFGNDHFALRRLLEDPAIQGAVDFFDEGASLTLGIDAFSLAGPVDGPGNASVTVRQQFGNPASVLLVSCDGGAVPL